MLTKDDLEAIDQLIEKRISPIANDTKSIKKNIKTIKKDQKDLFNFLDAENVDTKRRLKRIEDHLNLPKTS